MSTATAAVPLRPARAREGTRRYRRRLPVASQVALAVLCAIVAAAVFAPLLSPYDPAIGDIASRLRPIGTPGHPLGTDEQGRDLLTRLMYGGRVSLLAAVVPVGITVIVSLLLGLLAGATQGVLNTMIMRTLDVFFAFPAVMLAIGITAVLGPGLQNAFAAMVIVFTPPLTRVVESATRRVVGFEYIHAARLTGASRSSLLLRQVLPNVLPVTVTYAASLTGVAMLLMAGLSFVGLGIQPPTPEWGYMLGSMRDHLYTSPVNAITPGVMIFITAVALNIFSDGLRDAGDQ